MVELTGDIFDLDSLQWWSAQSDSPLCSVVKKDDKYWLKSARFGLHIDPSSVRAEAKELIPVIKGFAKVRNMDMKSVGIGSAISIGESTHQVIEGLTATAKIMVWKETTYFS